MDLNVMNRFGRFDFRFAHRPLVLVKRLDRECPVGRNITNLYSKFAASKKKIE